MISDLSEEQWATLDRINDTLTKEYATRRQMLLTRCDVTVQSFRWSDHLKVGNRAYSLLWGCSWHVTALPRRSRRMSSLGNTSLVGSSCGPLPLWAWHGYWLPAENC